MRFRFHMLALAALPLAAALAAVSATASVPSTHARLDRTLGEFVQAHPAFPGGHSP